jgi:hypothetical protein
MASYGLASRNAQHADHRDLSWPKREAECAVRVGLRQSCLKRIQSATPVDADVGQGGALGGGQGGVGRRSREGSKPNSYWFTGLTRYTETNSELK